ncbi:hypothetical protein MSAN_01541800 [Mycena sanguinolenta]|uniref:F-box domain-containing protein n=1 Tax=Mycena sanguinolenta TaxID=230812 RepID=A0A8H6Y7B6_9AGAR|nr:hypothetical protein MSAN_01541800 [Mycena sanguinolenta]
MSSPTTLFLADLAPDIIFSVFALCDICSVVAAGQTCRSMHDLAFDRSVWRNLLRNLQRRSILDCTLAVNLETLSTDQMIAIVRQLITGPQTWSPPEPDGAAVADVSREITLHLPARTGPQHSQKKAKLLPSGLYVLVDNSGTVECWNVANNKLVWRHISAEGLEFAAEEDIELAIVVIILVFSRTGANFRSCVEIVSLDLQTGNHTCLLTVRAVDYNLNKPFAAPVICGTLAAVCINSGANAWMIINWKAQSYFIVQSPSPTLHVALVPRHIILMDHSVDRKTQVHLISNDTLRAYWAPTIDVAGSGKLSSVFAEDIPKLSTFQETSHQHSTGRLHIYIYPSPLREDSASVRMPETERAVPAATPFCFALGRVRVLTGGHHDAFSFPLSSPFLFSSAFPKPTSVCSFSLAHSASRAPPLALASAPVTRSTEREGRRTPCSSVGALPSITTLDAHSV